MADAVFIGGTGRSGTSILGRLLGHHSRFAFITTEMKFHCQAEGVPTFLEPGGGDLDAFASKMRRELYPKRSWEPIRAHTSVDRLEELLGAFGALVPHDPIGAGHGLLDGLLHPVAAAAGKPSWVEATPSNAKYAGALYRMFPNMKIIHIVRDGRDVASSRLRGGNSRTLPGFHENYSQALRWWGKRLRLCEEGLKQVPSDRVHVVQFEDLMARDRDRTYAAILDFLEIEDEPQLREFFVEEVTAERAHIGRWREDPLVTPAEADRAYREVMDELHAAGVSSLPTSAFEAA